ncbi:MAG: acyltransferase [Isosphaeraceae bacterium]|nr:acyltransferase [Isosphaeraceae bacterium]
MSRTESGVARLPFLDGLRGLAALYVLLHHAALAVSPAGLSGVGLAIRFGLRHGHFAVAVFIVLSGFCLMRPVVHEPAGRLRGGLWPYLGRRARRIVPPYYAALGFSWLLIVLVPALGHPPRTWWDRALPVFGGWNAVSHLLLVHNLSVHWFFKIDPPSWSVATEWQIYLLFPALLVVWRRWGITAAVAAGFAIGYGVACLAGPFGNPALRQACPWYVGLFALGMAAAAASRAGERPAVEERSRGRWPTVALCLVALSLAGLALSGRDDREFMAGDPLVGVLTGLLLVRCTRLATSGGAPSGARMGLFRRWRDAGHAIDLRRFRCANRSAQQTLSRTASSFKRPVEPGVACPESSMGVVLFPGGLATPVEDSRRATRPHEPPWEGGSVTTTAPRSPLLRLLEGRWAVGLGAVSYSLYLVHYPLLALADAVLRSRAWSADARLAAQLLVAVPVCLLAAVVFHRLFERPFLADSAGSARRAGIKRGRAVWASEFAD